MVKVLSSGYGPSLSIDASIKNENGEFAVVETELSFKRDGSKKIVSYSFAGFLLQEIDASLEE
ncbi:hypothetical protein N4G41_19985 [Kosakonia sacchari]|uniref:hypothetical protein n=1 Tax=Kosakonia sacchari TaxID=1158459 RepID=UPI002ACDEBC2|nr:hypothetical protein [Kosakonia sacchari]MDZ7323914.1 hypothetical protein [Kosakonia sacchari]